MPTVIAVNYEDAMHAKYGDMGWCIECNDFKDCFIEGQSCAVVYGKCRHPIIDVEKAKELGLITF